MSIKYRKEKTLLNLNRALVGPPTNYNINLSISAIELKTVSVCLSASAPVMYITFVISLIVLVVD